MIVAIFIWIFVKLNAVSAQSYSYEPTASNGPSAWGTLFPACASGVQSPIHISMAPLDDTLAIPAFNVLSDGCVTWTQATSKSYFYIDFTQSGATCNNLFMSYEGQNWILQQMKFHSPSEHTQGGGYHDGEIQFKHISTKSGHTAMVSVFVTMQDSINTQNNTFLNRIWRGQSLSKLATTQKITTTISYDLDPYQDFFPGNQGHFQYIGSNTEPPCSTDVDWFIFSNPVTISSTDLNIIRGIPKLINGNILSLMGDNNRPEQHNTVPVSVKYCDGTTTYQASTSTSTSYFTTKMSKDQSAIALAAIAFIIALIALGLGIYLYIQYRKRLSVGGGSHTHTPLINNNNMNEQYMSPIHNT